MPVIMSQLQSAFKLPFSGVKTYCLSLGKVYFCFLSWWLAGNIERREHRVAGWKRWAAELLLGSCGKEEINVSESHDQCTPAGSWNTEEILRDFQNSLQEDQVGARSSQKPASGNQVFGNEI